MILSAPIPAPVQLPVQLPTKFFAAHAREMAHLITLGVDTAEAVGQYFGLTSAQTAQLLDSTYFKALIGEAQAELKDVNTVMERARAMARLASPEAVTTLLQLSRNSDDARVSKDSAETLLNIAGLQTKPSSAAPQGAGAGLAISISFTSQPPAVAPLVTLRDAIDVTPQPLTQDAP